jgi:EAL domain-containing protein (putative c-di-GMP-specific phosphodiesterase class I)
LRARRQDDAVRSAAPEIEAGSVRDLRRLTRKAMADAVHLSRLLASGGVRCRVSVNILSSQLNSADFEALLSCHTEQRELRDAITFEVTETEEFAKKNEAKLLVTQKVLQGYRFALDDFGVGASNLDRLADLPIQELKIDRRFVDGCADRSFNRAVCRSAIEIARETQARVVAEGVEREADLACLREMGVDWVQGYLVAKPMNRAALTTWLTSGESAR